MNITYGGFPAQHSVGIFSQSCIHSTGFSTQDTLPRTIRTEPSWLSVQNSRQSLQRSLIQPVPDVSNSWDPALHWQRTLIKSIPVDHVARSGVLCKPSVPLKSGLSKSVHIQSNWYCTLLQELYREIPPGCAVCIMGIMKWTSFINVYQKNCMVCQCCWYTQSLQMYHSSTDPCSQHLILNICFPIEYLKWYIKGFVLSQLHMFLIWKL